MTKENQSHSRILMVVPTLGQRANLLRKTLDSIKSQSPVELDIVMIFPLKNKETAKLAKEYGAICVQDPGSLSGALNAGIAVAAKPHHEYIGWIGDDDLLAPQSLNIAMTELDGNPDAVLAFGYCDYIDDNGRKLFTSKAGSLAPWIMTWGPNLVPLPGIVFRQSALSQAGIFDETNKYSMDLDMLLRLRKLGKFINTKNILASFRWHSSSTTVANRSAVLKETETVKRKYLPKPLQLIAPIWEIPVRFATKIAAERVSSLAKH